jgi:hypothetical protein
MRHIFAAAIVIAASTAYAFAGGQSGKPRFVKALASKNRQELRAHHRLLR